MRRVIVGDKTFFSSAAYYKRLGLRCRRQTMAKRITDNIITGSDPRLGVFLYYSPHFDINIWRRVSSLTGERTSKDPAFKGFRQSGSRLKQASPIASSLYKLAPKEVKEYALFRTLTGQAIKMLKEGMEALVITEVLKKKYIDPLLETTEKVNREIGEPMTGDVLNDAADFTSYPQIPRGERKMTRKRRSLLLQKIREGGSVDKYFSCPGSDSQPQTVRHVADSPVTETKSSEKAKRIKTTDGLIFLGHLPECKTLKMWLRPEDLQSWAK